MADTESPDPTTTAEPVKAAAAFAVAKTVPLATLIAERRRRQAMEVQLAELRGIASRNGH